MVDFWFNHFNVYSYAWEPSIPAYEREAIRPYVLGRFRDLLGATAAHPAMLFFLDNYLNRPTGTVNGRGHPGPQRELRPRAAGAAHGGRGRGVHPGRRADAARGVHRLGHRGWGVLPVRVRPATSTTAEPRASSA